MLDAVPFADDLIKQFEGLRLKPYRDIKGLWTIGYGCRTLPNGEPVTADTPEIDYNTAIVYLNAALGKVIPNVDDLVKVPVTPRQRGALYSLTYNIGGGAFAGSTLLRMLNQGRPAMAMLHFMDWVKADGRIVTDLVRRRHVEQAMFKRDLPLKDGGLGPAPMAPVIPDPPDDADALNDAELSKVSSQPV